MIRSSDDIVNDAYTLKSQLKLGYQDSIDDYMTLFSMLTYREVVEHLKKACEIEKCKVVNANEVIATLGTYAIKTNQRALLHKIYGCSNETEWFDLRQKMIKERKDV